MKKELRARLKKVLDDTEEQLEQIAEVVAALIARRAAHNYLCPKCEERFTEQEAGGANKGECPAGCDAFLIRDDLALSAGPRIIDDPEGAGDRWLAAKGDDAHDDDPETDDQDTFTPAEARRRRIALPGKGPRVVDGAEDEVQPGVASKRPTRQPANPHHNDVQRGVRKSGGQLDAARLDRLPRPTPKSTDGFPKARRGGSRWI
jgi:hypothetical protein